MKSWALRKINAAAAANVHISCNCRDVQYYTVSSCQHGTLLNIALSIQILVNEKILELHFCVIHPSVHVYV